MHISCCISTQTHTHAPHNAHLYRCLTILLGDNLQKKCRDSTPTRWSNGFTLNEELATANCCTYHNQLLLLDCMLLRTAGQVWVIDYQLLFSKALNRCSKMAAYLAFANSLDNGRFPYAVVPSEHDLARNTTQTHPELQKRASRCPRNHQPTFTHDWAPSPLLRDASFMATTAKTLQLLHLRTHATIECNTHTTTVMTT